MPINTKILLEYKITLQYANVLPVVNLGTKEKPNWTPPEICNIPNDQPFRGTLPDVATAAMIKRLPHNHSGPANENCQQSGLSVSSMISMGAALALAHSAEPEFRPFASAETRDYFSFAT